MKKNVRKRKKKKINRYIPILASGLLIALTVLVISWVFSARRTYTVVILKEGAEQVCTIPFSGAGKGRNADADKTSGKTKCRYPL